MGRTPAKSMWSLQPGTGIIPFAIRLALTATTALSSHQQMEIRQLEQLEERQLASFMRTVATLSSTKTVLSIGTSRARHRTRAVSFQLLMTVAWKLTTTVRSTSSGHSVINMMSLNVNHRLLRKVSPKPMDACLGNGSVLDSKRCLVSLLAFWSVLPGTYPAR